MGRKQEIINAFGNTLREFGYDSYTNEQVEVDISLALKGETEGNITASFIQEWLNGEYKRLRPECEELFRKAS